MIASTNLFSFIPSVGSDLFCLCRPKWNEKRTARKRDGSTRYRRGGWTYRFSQGAREENTKRERARRRRQEIEQKRWGEKRENGKKDARNRMKIVEGEACECKECEKGTKDGVGAEWRRRRLARKKDERREERMTVHERKRKWQKIQVRKINWRRKSERWRVREVQTA